MQKFIEKFKVNELLLARVGAWNISLRPAQVTLGSLILSLDRECPNLCGLTPKEGEELSSAFVVIEKVLNETFKPDKINYLALMMVDNQVHFHVIPRYSAVRDFEGVGYEDVNWPKPPNVLSKIDLSDENLLKLFQYLKNMIKES